MIDVEINKKEEKTESESRFFLLGSCLYAVLYTFCLYRNYAGITYPFFIGGTLFFFCCCIRKCGITFKKDAWFYITAAGLLGISVFLTSNYVIITITKTGIFLLVVSFMLHHFYEDASWEIGKYTSAIVRTIFRSAACFPMPFLDGFRFLAGRKKGNNKKVQAVFLGLLIGIPMVLFATLLLSTADAIFAQILESVMGALDFSFLPENLIPIILMDVFGYVSVYCFLCSLTRKRILGERRETVRREPLIAITFSGALSIVYLLFCGVQVAGFFLQERILPEGYTYAEYAREGFFQLLFISVLNLFLVLFCRKYFRDSKILKGILTLVCICTYIMIASSAARMLLYISEYYLTFLRILVLWALLVLAILITGVLVSIYRESFPLFRYGMIVVTAFYILLAFSQVDYWIARYNTSQIKKVEKEGELLYDFYYDISYLTDLSADAAPALADYYRKTEKGNGVRDMLEDYYFEAYRYGETDMRKLNLSLLNAQKYTNGLQITWEGSEELSGEYSY